MGAVGTITVEGDMVHFIIDHPDEEFHVEWDMTVAEAMEYAADIFNKCWGADPAYVQDRVLSHHTERAN